eukprot:533347_1
MTFADGVYRKSKYLNIAGRLIEGGALGAKRVPVILYCTCRFKKTNLAFALGCLSMAHRLSMVIGPLLIINLFMERWRMADSLPMLYWSATVFLIPGTVLSILVWLCNRYHYSHKALAVRNASTENKSNSIDATQTSSALSGVPSVMDLHEFVKQTKHIFGNRIFVLMLLLCVFNEGCYAAFQGSLKQFLKHKFNRAEKEVGVDIGVIMYFGLVAPLTGYMVDRLRHRELFILFGSSCVLLSHVILAFGVASDCNRWMGLLH